MILLFYYINFVFNFNNVLILTVLMVLF